MFSSVNFAMVSVESSSRHTRRRKDIIRGRRRRTRGFPNSLPSRIYLLLKSIPLFSKSLISRRCFLTARTSRKIKMQSRNATTNPTTDIVAIVLTVSSWAVLEWPLDVFAPLPSVPVWLRMPISTDSWTCRSRRYCVSNMGWLVASAMSVVFVSGATSELVSSTQSMSSKCCLK